MLAQRFPFPPNRGDRIRSYHLLRFLSQHFEVCLGCTTDEMVSPDQLAHIQLYCDSVAVGTTSRFTRILGAFHSAALGHSLTEGFFYSSQLSKSIQQMHRTKKFDAILVFCSSMYPYAIRGSLKTVPILVDLVDVDSRKWRQLAESNPIPKKWLYAFESHRVKQLERAIIKRAFALTLVSDQEAELFREDVGAHLRLRGISNGVDTEYFSPLSTASRETSNTAATRLVFTGVMDYPPNVEGILWFCREVMPLIQSHTEVQLDIVGRRPNASVRKLASNPAVRVVGEVPDVRPYLAQAHIAISPLHLARGIQNKVLEAMASGLPLVVTPQSAEGIAAEDGVHFSVAETAAGFARRVVELAQDPKKRLQFAVSARELVVSKYSWSAKLAPFRQLLLQSVE